MGTEVHYKNSFAGYHSMRNANEDSNNSSWLFYGDNTLTNGHYYDALTPRTVTDAYPGHDKDELKQKMIHHEAVFKNQVHELHRLYKRQQDIMEEVKRKDFPKYHISIDTSSSSNLIPSQKPYEDGNKWQIPLANSPSARPSIFGVDISNSPLSCSKGNVSKDCEVVECRPSKVRKKLFDLELPANENVESEEDNQASESSNFPPKENGFVPKNGVKIFLDDGGKKDCNRNIASGQHSMRPNGLADLNEPVHIHESNVDFLGPSAKPAALNHLDRFSSGLRETGNSRSNMNYISQCKVQTPSDTMLHWHGKEVQLRGSYSELNHTPLHFNASSAYPYVNTPEMGYSWSSSGPSWGKLNDNFTRKLTSLQTHPSFLSSPQSHEVFRDRWHGNGNGFHNGSSSGSKHLSARLPSVGFDYRNCNKINDGPQKIYNSSNFVDLTGTTNGMDLNTVQTLSNEDENLRKHDQTDLPWLRPGAPKVKDESLAGDKKLLGIPIFGKFCISKNEATTGISTSASVEHRGIDINVAWDDVSASKQIDVKTCNEKREETDAEIKNFKNQFDLNSCVTEDDDILVTECIKSSKKMAMEIDLEAPAVEEVEEEIEHTETEPKLDNPENEELLKIAAETIVAISSQQDHAEPVCDTTNENETNVDMLLWFVEVISSCERKTISPTHEPDEYEKLTLQLEETKEEDYMPKPIVPDFQEPDEVGAALTSRPRRGQARRGRPRRDFQRDILPAMTSLSRPEITEDVQIFGGLMRATGHSWNLGSARKNGKRLGARGKRKVKVAEPIQVATPPRPPPPTPPSTPCKQVNNVEVVGLEERSLTGWGKTTRRPRRQRCAAGNTSVAVQLT